MYPACTITDSSGPKCPDPGGQGLASVIVLSLARSPLHACFHAVSLTNLGQRCRFSAPKTKGGLWKQPLEYFRHVVAPKLQ
jgi:hypothetical protein